MINGVAIREIKKLNDDRGFLMEILRSDWKEASDALVQSNLSVSRPGVIRAWHRHLRGQVDYILVAEGSVKLCIFDETTKEMDEIICSGETPVLVRVPGDKWHGYKVLGDAPASVIYFFNRLYDYNNPDEQRKEFDDKSIIPVSVNGHANDKRAVRHWEW